MCANISVICFCYWKTEFWLAVGDFRESLILFTSVSDPDPDSESIRIQSDKWIRIQIIFNQKTVNIFFNCI